MNPLGWMLTETVDGVCLPGMISPDLTIAQQGRGSVTLPPPVRAVVQNRPASGRVNAQAAGGSWSLAGSELWAVCCQELAALVEHAIR